MKMNKRNMRAIICALVAGAIGYEIQMFIQAAIKDYDSKKRPDYSRIGRVRVRKGTKSGFRSDGVLWDDDEDNWLVKTIDI